MSKISEVEQEVLAHIQKNNSLKTKVSLSELAEECHVSKSTVVKLAKKLGYSGYVEMVHKMHNEKEWAESFRDDLIEGDLEWAVRKIARKFREYENCKNIIAKSPYGDFTSNYFVRKLQMFNIFAVDTYDYAMVMNSRQKKGFALFYNKSSAYSHYAELMKIAQKEGYYIIVFGEDPSDQLIRYADFHVIFKKINYKTADFYSAQLLIFLEMVLTEYSRIRREDEREEHERD